MPISSKTPPTERAPKSATGSRACQATAPAREAILHSNIQPGIQPGILDQLQDAVFTTDLNGIITSCNRGVNRYGFEAKELVGKNIAAFYGVEQQTFLASGAIASVLEEGRFEGELRCRTKSGEDVDVHLCLTLLRDSNAAPAGILGFSIERTGEITSPPQAAVAAAAIPLARRDIDGTQFLIASPMMHKFMGMVDRVAGHN